MFTLTCIVLVEVDAGVEKVLVSTLLLDAMFQRLKKLSNITLHKSMKCLQILIR